MDLAFYDETRSDSLGHKYSSFIENRAEDAFPDGDPFEWIASDNEHEDDQATIPVLKSSMSENTPLKPPNNGKGSGSTLTAIQAEALLYVDGWRNVPLLLSIPVTIMLTGIWEVVDPEIFEIYGVRLEAQDLFRDLCLFLIAFVSLFITPHETRVKNQFSWFPVLEVGQLFIGIFITIIPAISILAAGKSGALGFILDLVEEESGSNNFAYFWLTGGLSSFLDNAPTFLIFFSIAGGDDEVDALQEEVTTLLAISLGAVFLGANTYIGNAPNFMVKAVVEESGYPMPSFIGYLGISTLCLVPSLLIVSFVYFY